MLTSFVRGKTVTKALSIGMITVWPEIVKKIEEKLEKFGWSSLNEWTATGNIDDDDTYYIYIIFKPLHDKNINNLNIIINTEEKSVWSQLILEGDNSSQTKFEHLTNLSGDSDEIASKIIKQAFDIKAKFNDSLTK